MSDVRCDLALIPIGGTYTMDLVGSEKAAKEIKCKYIVPMHYATWSKIAQDPREFAESLSGSRVKVVLMRFGEEIELSP